MGAKKKYTHYTTEKISKDDSPSSVSSAICSTEDMRQISFYREKIERMLQNDTQMQKKAALIIKNLINQDNK